MTSTADATARQDPSNRGRRMPREANLLRRLPTCDPQPPFDDEFTIGAGVGDGASLPIPLRAGDHGQRALSLAFALPGGLPAVPALPDSLQVRPGAPDLRLVPALAASTNEPDRVAETAAGGRRKPRHEIADDDAAPQQTPRAHLPEPTPWGGRLVQGILEVLSGVRPISQLVRWTTADVYDSILTRAQHRSQIMSELRQVGPQRFAEVVRSVHVSEPTDGIAEVCAIVQQGPRCRAIALRLEGIDGRWQCTALQIG
jgi:Family of unknown function (DUF6459)